MSHTCSLTVIWSFTDLCNIYVLYGYRRFTTIGRLPAPHLAWVRSSLHFVFLWSPSVGLVSLTYCHLCSYSLMRNDNTTTISWSHFSFIYHHHHHHVVPQARISLTLSRHFSLSFISSGRSSGLHPVSSHSCWMHVRAGRPPFARPYVGVHRSTSLMSSSQLLQQWPACLVRLTWIVFVMGGRWPYSWCLVGCCCQEAAYHQQKRTSTLG